MDKHRRSIVSAAALAPAAHMVPGWAEEGLAAAPPRLVLSDFAGEEPKLLPNTGWRGFSDRVMGGISNADLNQDNVGGKSCIRLTGNVTRESNGGFIQMALYFGRNYRSFDASAYKGLELLVHGNNEDYNVHLRTNDCRWYDQSYRMTFFAKPEWQRIQIPWSAFEGNRLNVPLDTASLQRIAILGWMREFDADVSLAEIALYS